MYLEFGAQVHFHMQFANRLTTCLQTPDSMSQIYTVPSRHAEAINLEFGDFSLLASPDSSLPAVISDTCGIGSHSLGEREISWENVVYLHHGLGQSDMR
jgi:hypothetical protein